MDASHIVDLISNSKYVINLRYYFRWSIYFDDISWYIWLMYVQVHWSLQRVKEWDVRGKDIIPQILRWVEKSDGTSSAEY